MNKVKKILETVCHNCGKIKAIQNEEFKQAIQIRNRKHRFEKVWSLSKPRLICEADPKEDENEVPSKAPLQTIRHGGCGNAQPSIRKKGLQLSGTMRPTKGEEEEDNDPVPKRIFPQDALNIFNLISEDSLEMMGLNADYARPEWMILNSLPVPPPPVRPSISVDGSGQGQRGEDDLTFKLGDIIRANQAVTRTEVDGTPENIKVDLCDLLQYHIATYMDNDIAGLDRAQHKSGRPIKSIRA
ncbi:MAG: DNA-directed RNA polymerase II subunit rpb1, partial [Watsoniomyces obsoletus]